MVLVRCPGGTASDGGLPRGALIQPRVVGVAKSSWDLRAASGSGRIFLLGKPTGDPGDPWFGGKIGW